MITEQQAEQAEDLSEIRKTAEQFEKRKRDTSRLPRFYSRVLTRTLKDRMIECLSASSEEQVNIMEELVLIREAASLQVGVFDDAVNQYEEDKQNPKKRELAILAGSMMTDCFEKVTKTAKMANDIRQSAKDQFSIFDLQDIIGQIVHIIFASCGSEHQSLAEIMESKIEKELSFMQEKARISPDEVVMAMDSTVPYVECPEDPDGTKTVTEDVLI